MITLSTLGLAAAVAAVPAHAIAEGGSKWSRCIFETWTNEIDERYTTLLSPANGASVSVGTTVNFSAESDPESTLTFRVASSPALLESPDIDSGPGSENRGIYTFSTTAAAATPGAIYWDATYTRVLEGCEGPPVTFTTPPRELTITPATGTGSSPSLIGQPATPTTSAGPSVLLRVRLDDTRAFQPKHPSVSYRLDCTTSCRGVTYAKA